MAAQFFVSAIASLQKETIMTTVISAIARTTRRIRRTFKRLVRRLTRKASIKFGITVSVPPFLKLAIDYTADIGEAEMGKAANDNSRRRKPPRPA
jgi:hypothetical protein